MVSIRRLVSRFALPLAVLSLATCGAPPKPRDFPPMTYDYLPQIRLNVASVEIDNRFVPASRDEVSAQAPIPPITALRQMANDRLKAFGSSGKAILVIKDASLIKGSNEILGHMAVELDVYTSDNRRAGFATRGVRCATGSCPMCRRRQTHPCSSRTWRLPSVDAPNMDIPALIYADALRSLPAGHHGTDDRRLRVTGGVQG